MITMTEESSIDCRFLGPGGVHFRLSTVGSGPSEDATEARDATLCALHGHCFAHDRATASKNLQVGHGASAGRNVASGCGQRAKGGGRRFAQERAHGPGLTEKSLHSDGLTTLKIEPRYSVLMTFRNVVRRVVSTGSRGVE